jgi:energy-converting hydrogenase Eha subunit H
VGALGQRTKLCEGRADGAGLALFLFAGILFAVLVGTNSIAPLQTLGEILPAMHEEGLVGQLASAGLFLALAVIVARAGMRKVE